MESVYNFRVDPPKKYKDEPKTDRDEYCDCVSEDGPRHDCKACEGTGQPDKNAR